MTYSVYQHWDLLRVCIVGYTYPPEFCRRISNDLNRAGNSPGRFVN